MRRRLRHDGGTQLRLQDLSGFELVIGLIVGWSPASNRNRSQRWHSWRDYLRDWQRVRDEFFERYPDRRGPDRLPFAKRLVRFCARARPRRARRPSHQHLGHQARSD